MTWLASWRADPRGAALADRHYTRQKVGSRQFVPPGMCRVLITPCARAVWVTSWPKREFVKHQWAGAWVNSIFRNEGAGLSSDLIRAAIRDSIEYFEARGIGAPFVVPWRGMVTFVQRKKVRPKKDPGFCFLKAGFVRAGETKDEGHLAFTLHPSKMPGVPPYVPSSDAQPARVAVEP
jgi:hypothetical protein